MKRPILIALSALFLSPATALACEICGGGTGFLAEYTHGKTPGGAWDYLIVAVIALGTLSLVPYMLRCLFRPGEQRASHIKNLTLNQENHGN